MAIKVMPGITYTMGGIRIDADARVLNERGEPIAGLYAAGSATGGIEGGTDAVYLGGLVKAGVFGLLAAEHAAAEFGARAAPGTVGTKAAPIETFPEVPIGLDRYPMLKLTARHGGAVANLLAPLCALAAFVLLWPATGLWGLPLAIGAAALIWAGIILFVELVRLVTETLISG